MKPENIEGFPLSRQQKRLWQLQQQDGQAYAAQSAIQIKGKLDRETLKQALQRIIERHEILRTKEGVPKVQEQAPIAAPDGETDARDQQQENENGSQHGARRELSIVTESL